MPGKRSRGTGKEVIFDPQARQEYLRGMSERKRMKRSYGLAMQKVKDRKAKLEQRSERKKAMMEHIEEVEKQKNAIFNDRLEDREPTANALDQKGKSDEQFQKQTYQDAQTEKTWGGKVIVITSSHIPGCSSEDESEEVSKIVRRQGSDRLQEAAGKVDTYLSGKNPPGKRKASGNQRKHLKGKHGAAGMKGVGSSGNFKTAQKMLSRSEAFVKRGKTKTRGKDKR